VASPALSQVGGAWPTDGRIVGIVADETSDLAAVAAVRDAVDAAGMTPLVIGPHSGQLETPTERGQKKVPPVVVQRHAKAIGAWGAVDGVLEAAGAAGLPGVVTGDDPAAVLASVTDLLAEHRVWDRFPVVL